jgi:hypothetical protein
MDKGGNKKGGKNPVDTRQKAMVSIFLFGRKVLYVNIFISIENKE